jgi:hypothetical protein
MEVSVVDAAQDTLRRCGEGGVTRRHCSRVQQTKPEARITEAALQRALPSMTVL